MKNLTKMTLTNRSKSLIKKARLSLLSTVVMLFVVLSANSQKLEEFKEYASDSRMSKMPFSRIRKEGIPLEEAKEKAKGATDGYAYDKLKRAKDEILKKIKVQNDKIEDAEDDDDEVKGAKNIKAANDEIEDLEDDLESINKKIDKGIDIFKTLQEARRKVKEIYDDADDELDNALNRPHLHIGPKPSSSDKKAYSAWNDRLSKLKSYINTIGSIFDKKARTHKDEEVRAGKVVGKLETLRKKTKI